MKTTNYKNVVVVAMNNCAVVCNSNKQFKKVMNATDNTVASLEAMKIFLQGVPTNAEELVEEPRLLILGEKSAIKGFATGTNLQYIRTGENASGKAFTEEQLADNFQTLIDAINKAKPAAVKGQYLKSVTVTSTMGPGVKVNTAKLMG